MKEIFKNEQFGNIRVAGTSEEPLFCLADICASLELRQGDVRQRLNDGVVSTQPIIDSLGREQYASQNELKEITEIEKKVAFMIDMNFVNNNSELINALRKMYNDKYSKF